MTTAIFTTAYFPPISYFAAILPYKKVMIESFENYQKQSYRNRAYIAAPKGKQSINIPVIKTNGNHTPIKNIIISTETNWKKQHWNSIETAYNSSPFLMYYEDEIKAILFKNHKYLWNLNWELLELMLELLQIETSIEETTSYDKSPEGCYDFRTLIHPKLASIISPQKNNSYYQVFNDKNGFINDLSCLDILFNLGPDAGTYIRKIRL